MLSIPSILTFKPIYKTKIWGGEKLKKDFGRETTETQIGESWELSDFGEEISRTTNINFWNQSFRELYSSQTDIILGTPFRNQKFPLLIKVIDAKEKLSVQVHPDDSYAEKFDPISAGKKECWLVLSADKGSELVVGFNRKTDKMAYRSLVGEHKAEDVLKKWEVKAGDVFLINPGTIHAIGAGVVLLEIQQSSDSTYRVFDYGRLGDDGKLRDLHLDKALDVLNFDESDESEKQIPLPIENSPFQRMLLTSNDKFRLESWHFPQAQNLNLVPLTDPLSFGLIHITKGQLMNQANKLLYGKGDTLFLTPEAFRRSETFQVSPNTEMAFMGAGTDWVRWR